MTCTDLSIVRLAQTRDTSTIDSQRSALLPQLALPVYASIATLRNAFNRP